MKITGERLTRLTFLSPWLRPITSQIPPDEQWRIVKPQLRRALEIRSPVAT